MCRLRGRSWSPQHALQITRASSVPTPPGSHERMFIIGATAQLRGWVAAPWAWSWAASGGHGTASCLRDRSRSRGRFAPARTPSGRVGGRCGHPCTGAGTRCLEGGFSRSVRRRRPKPHLRIPPARQICTMLGEGQARRSVGSRVSLAFPSGERTSARATRSSRTAPRATVPEPEYLGHERGITLWHRSPAAGRAGIAMRAEYSTVKEKQRRRQPFPRRGEGSVTQQSAG